MVFSNFLKYYQLCRSAVNEVSTRLDNLNTDFQLRYEHNPINRIDERIKNIHSLMHKVARKGIPKDLDMINRRIHDIAGVRVIVNYIDDVYLVRDALLAQSDIKLIRTRDYIKHPKDNGYRSLHLVVSVPVFQTDGKKIALVEVQIRTMGMDMWASLDEKMHYQAVKNSQAGVHAPELEKYAGELNSIERDMQTIFTELGETD